MNEKELKKIFKNNSKYLLTVVILFIVSIVMFAMSTPVEEEESPKDYNDLIVDKQDQEGSYATVTIDSVPILFATNDYENYYIVMDTNNYMYLSRLTDDTYNKLEKEYSTNKSINYTLTGYLYNAPEELQKLAMDIYNEEMGEEIITKYNYHTYFGSTYLDETNNPNANDTFLAIGFILIIVSIIIFIVYLVNVIKTKKTYKKYSKEELTTILQESTTIAYPKANIYLTSKYIISTSSGITVTKYEDLVWMYIQRRTYNFINIGTNLLGRTNNNKVVNLAVTYRNNYLLEEIISEIEKHNKNILIGYTKENSKAYRETVKNKK